MVVDRENFLGEIPPEEIFRPVHDEADSLPRLLMRQIFASQTRSSPGINQVIKTRPRYVLLLDQVENRRNLPDVALRDRETDPHFDSRIAADPDAAQRPVESSGHAPEQIVDRPDPVQAHADIGQPDISQFFRHGGSNERPVRGYHHPQAEPRRRFRELQEILPDEGFASGQQDHRAPERSKVFEKFLSLVRGQFALCGGVRRSGIAVHAFQIAPARHVPDYNGPLVRRELKQMRRKLLRFAAVAEDIGGFDCAAI